MLNLKYIILSFLCFSVLILGKCDQPNKSNPESPLAKTDSAPIWQVAITTTTTLTTPNQAASALLLLPTLIITAPVIQSTISETLPISYAVPIARPEWGLTLSDQHIYWADQDDSTALKRLSLSNPTVPEVIAQGTYTREGAVSNMQVSDNNQWLLYLDRQSRNVGGAWKLTALHLPTLQSQVIFDDSGAPFEQVPIPSPSMIWWGVGTDSVVITYALLPDEDDCQRIVTLIVNLHSRENERVAETDCGRESAIWLWPELAKHYLVAEEDHPSAAGGGTDIILYDLSLSTLLRLTADRINRAPQVSDQYVIWKRSHGAQLSNVLGVYNQATKEQWLVNLPIEPPWVWLNQHWVYWLGGSQPLHIYDLERNTFVLVANSKNCNDGFKLVAMKGNIVAWTRSSGVLEWRAIDPTVTTPFMQCEEVPV